MRGVELGGLQGLDNIVVGERRRCTPIVAEANKVVSPAVVYNRRVCGKPSERLRNFRAYVSSEMESE